MSDKRPTPFNLTIVTEGVNHVMQYKSEGTATAAYRQLMRAVSTPSNGARVMYEVTDDFNGLVHVDPSGVRSVRLIDVNAEHRANMQLKLAELYAAHSFEDMVRSEHPALVLAKARNPNLIRPS